MSDPDTFIEDIKASAARQREAEGGSARRRRQRLRIIEDLVVRWIHERITTDTEARVRDLHTFYTRSANPLFVWWAYSLCHGHLHQIPEWVLQYLDGVHDKIHAARSARNINSALVDALGMKQSVNSGAGTIFSRFEKFVRDNLLAMAVEIKTRDDTKPYMAWEPVADTFGFGKQIVSRAHREHGPFLKHVK